MPEPSSDLRPHLVVLGLMGIGKSTTAQAMARARGVAWYDSDTDLEATFGKTGGELADELGLDELHRLESAVLLGRLADVEPAVISAAAAIVEDPRCREALAHRARVVVLNAPVDEILRRMATGSHRRVMPKNELVALAERRAPLFAAVSDLDLDATQPTSDLVTAIVDIV
jgi:shikimate kinase